MFKLILLGAGLITVTVVLHAAGTLLWTQQVRKRWEDRGGRLGRFGLLGVLVPTAVALLALHVVEVVLWALSYLLLVPDQQLASFESAVYFSLVTFTTLGYGDITLGPEWRLLSGIEALNGILLAGWSTALLFAILQRYWDYSAGQVPSGKG